MWCFGLCFARGPYLELTVAMEDLMGEAAEQKCFVMLSEHAEPQECGWSTDIHPVKVNGMGFIAVFNTSLPKDLSIKGQNLV